MAFITLDVNKLKYNFEYLDKLFREKGIMWSVVSKLLCGNKIFLKELLNLDIRQVCDSRVSNLKMIKSIRPEIETIYIKPPAKRSIPGVIRNADISLNSEISTIRLLAEEAGRQGKVHKVIIMIELGDLREGIMGEDLMRFYDQVFELDNIEVIGIGTSLSCLYGVLPNQDKLIQLTLYKQLIEAKYKRKIPLVSGGSSVTIPLIFQNLLPKGINHFRVGESLFLGTDVYNNSSLENMKDDVFRIYSEIIEVTEKPAYPFGETGTNVEGHSHSMDEDKKGESSLRAIVDLGLLDVGQEHIRPVDMDLELVGASSDMFVIDLGENKKGYAVGDLVELKADYMGILRLLNSYYIEKQLAASNLSGTN